MPLWDSAYCLEYCQDSARRPATDAAMPAARWYRLLTASQPEVYDDLFTRYPDLGYSAPVGPLTTADGGKTYTFGSTLTATRSDQSATPSSIRTSEPSLTIRSSPALISFSRVALSEFRTTGRGSSTLAPTLASLRWPIERSTQANNPQLQPKHARELLCLKALEKWARRPGSGSRPTYWKGLYDERLQKIYAELATAYNMRGSQAGAATGGQVWWYSSDLGQSGLNL
jgi:hypothetical protein